MSIILKMLDHIPWFQLNRADEGTVLPSCTAPPSVTLVTPGVFYAQTRGGGVGRGAGPRPRTVPLSAFLNRSIALLMIGKHTVGVYHNL